MFLVVGGMWVIPVAVGVTDSPLLVVNYHLTSLLTRLFFSPLLGFGLGPGHCRGPLASLTFNCPVALVWHYVEPLAFSHTSKIERIERFFLL